MRNKKYTKTIKNGGLIPPVSDERALHIAVGCGNCIECRKQKAREWQVRLQEDIKEFKNGKFITLTFSNKSIKELVTIIRKRAADEIKQERTKKLDKDGSAIEKILFKTRGYELDNNIATTAIRLFLERWRKEHGKSLRHWLVTELGHNGTENIHLHGIIWTNDINKLEKIWNYGHVWKGKEKNGTITNYVNAKTVNYIIKYVSKMDSNHKYYKSKILCSPGIGKHYITQNSNSKENKFVPNETNETYRTETGHKIALPIYYRNKIYSDKEREQLWLEKLDKEKRYVLGTEVDTLKTMKHYFKMLENAQEKNKRLGYGNSKIEWKKRHYENTRREMMLKKRIQNT